MEYKEITPQELEEFKERIGEEANNMTEAELLRSKQLIRQLAGVLFDMWLRDRQKEIQSEEI